MKVETEAIEPREGAGPFTAGFRLATTDASVSLLSDTRVSRFHCEIVVDGATARVRDLGSHSELGLSPKNPEQVLVATLEWARTMGWVPKLAA